MCGRPVSDGSGVDARSPALKKCATSDDMRDPGPGPHTCREATRAELTYLRCRLGCCCPSCSPRGGHTGRYPYRPHSRFCCLLSSPAALQGEGGLPRGAAPVEYRAVNPGPGGDAGITRRRAGGSRHKHRGWVRRGQAARIPTWNASPRVGVSTRQGGDVAQEISQSRASVLLATSHSNSIVHAIPGYPASSPGRPFVRL